MYHISELFDCENYLVPLEDHILAQCAEECTFLQEPCDTDVFNVCEFLLSEANCHKSDDPFDAVDLYSFLRTSILSLL